jgi:hypothetical protein
MNRLIDLTGRTFGKWSVLGRAENRSKGTAAYWLCKCECGLLAPVHSNSLRVGRSLGCKKCDSTLRSGRPQLHRRKRPYGSTFKKVCSCAARKGQSMTLTYDEFLKFTTEDRCHYCWAPIRWVEFNATHASGGQRYNLDRKNNTRGYDADNLVVCCSKCNFTKLDQYDYETWYVMTAVLRARNSSLIDRTVNPTVTLAESVSLDVLSAAS